MTDHYFVTWTIDVWADSPREAAEKARGHQTREDTTAVVFDVLNVKTKQQTQVDLLDLPLNSERKV